MLRRNTLAALVDQACVSGTSFLVAVAVGRYCGEESLGIYALGISVITLVAAGQNALVLTPFTIYRARAVTPAAEYAGATLVSAGWLIGCAVLILFLGSILFATTGLLPGFQPIAWLLPAVVPLYALREFARRFDFAILNHARAAALDGAVLCLSLIGIAVAYATDHLTAATAIASVALACGIVAGTWMIVNWTGGKLVFRQLWPGKLFRREWRLGRWALADQVVSLIHLYCLHWILAAMLSPAATGQLTACATIAALANPFLQGIGNVLAPYFAVRVSEASRDAVLSLFWKSTAALVLVMASGTLFLHIFREEILSFVYADEAFTGLGLLLTLLAVRPIFVAPIMTTQHVIFALEQPQGSVWSSVSGLLTTLVLAFPLISAFGTFGAGWAALGGAIVECAMMCAFFKTVLDRWSAGQLLPSSGGAS